LIVVSHHHGDKFPRSDKPHNAIRVITSPTPY
jgi:hypothetical protein